MDKAYIVKVVYSDGEHNIEVVTKTRAGADEWIRHTLIKENNGYCKYTFEVDEVDFVDA
jgi:hypothetical protein